MKTVKDPASLASLTNRTGAKVKAKASAQKPVAAPPKMMSQPAEQKPAATARPAPAPPINADIARSIKANAAALEKLTEKLASMEPAAKTEIAESIAASGKANVAALEQVKEQISGIKSAPTPAPHTVTLDSGSDKVAETIVNVGKSNASMLQEIKQQIGKIEMKSSEPITHWEFTFQRDKNGYLTKLIANAENSAKVLN